MRVKRRSRSGCGGVRPTDLQNDVDQLARAIEQIQGLLQRVEEEVRAGAQERIQQLRTEAREQLLALRAREHEAMQILTYLSRAPQDAWGHLEQAADCALHEALELADSIIELCRLMVSERTETT